MLLSRRLEWMKPDKGTHKKTYEMIYANRHRIYEHFHLPSSIKLKPNSLDGFLLLISVMWKIDFSPFSPSHLKLIKCVFRSKKIQRIQWKIKPLFTWYKSFSIVISNWNTISKHNDYFTVCTFTTATLAKPFTKNIRRMSLISKWNETIRNWVWIQGKKRQF